MSSSMLPYTFYLHRYESSGRLLYLLHFGLA